MTEQEIIQALKVNKEPFCMMSAEKLKKAKDIGVIEFFVMTVDTRGCLPKWLPAEGDFYPNTALTYRLRLDYEEKPVFTEHEIFEDGSLLFCKSGRMCSVGLSELSTQSNFFGFKQEGRVWGRLYKRKNGTRRCLSFDAKDIDNYEVCDMTEAVALFKEADKK